MNRLGEEFKDQVDVLQLDVGQPANAELQSQYDLRGHPSFVVLDGNSLVVQRFLGPQTEEALRQAMLTVAGQ